MKHANLLWPASLALAAHLLLCPATAFAQSPSSIAGRTIQLNISSGSSPFASSGSYRFLPSALDSSYAIVPISGLIAASTGPYSYAKTGASTALLSFTDSVAGALTADCTFTTASSGTYVLTGGGGNQSGTFTLYSGTSPASIAGNTVTVTITSGATPFATSGSYQFKPAASGNAYSIIRISGSVVNSSGTYAYTQNSAATAYIAYDDSIVGPGYTAQLSFDTATTGTVYLLNPGTGGYQTGTFTMSIPPTITAQPQNRTVSTGASVTFSVTATGTPSPSYQWRKDGTNLTGATSTSYTIASAQTSHAGTYTVFVSNTAGSVTSASAMLTVNPSAPVITSATSATATVGQSFTYQIAANNTPTGFGATGLPSGLTVNPVSGLVSGTPTVTGTFSVTLSATNAGGTGTATLTLAVLTVNPPTLAITGFSPAVGSPGSLVMITGGDFTSATAVRFGGNAASFSVTAASLIFATVPLTASTGPISVTTSSGTATTSSNFVVNGTAPSISDQPQSQTVTAGANVTFGVTASGAPTPSYQWRKNGTNLTGATLATLSLTNVQAGDAGTYSVFLTNSAGSVTSAGAVLTVNPPAPVITSSLTATGTIGQAFSYQITAGNGPANYGASVLPAGLTVNPASGLISGTPSSLGTFTVTISATNTGGAGTATLNLTVKALPSGTVVAWGNNGGPAAFAGGQTNVPANLSGVVAIAGGGYHSLALKSDGTVTAWGYNGYGEADVPIGLREVVAIAAGSYHSVALKRDGTVVTWGANYYGQRDFPPDLAGVTAIAAGYDHALALRNDGTVVAWGYNTHGQTNVPGSLNGVIAIAAGQLHSVALKSDGTVTAWGSDYSGTMIVPPGLNGVTAIAAGVFFTTALKSDGTVLSWGSGATVPIGLSGVTAIAASGGHTLALKTDGTVLAWGDNSKGQTAVPLWLSGVTRIAAGERHSLALVGMGALPLVITSPAWSRTNGFAHGVGVQVGTAYRVQLSTNLVNWTDLTNFTATATTAQIRDAAATNMTRRFYRVVSP